ncbi:MAG: hypothetical protein H7Z39_18370 [Burkholderiaceae bacterium]|nr:hypothetical protein [Burkholderiaceae bacterium]
MDRFANQDYSSTRFPLRAHRAPDPVPVEEPLPEDFPHPVHPVPQEDPVPDPNPS